MATTERVLVPEPVNATAGRPPDEIPAFADDTLYAGPVIARTTLNVAWRTWLNMRNTGSDLPPATRVGRRLYYKGRDVNAWLESRREAR